MAEGHHQQIDAQIADHGPMMIVKARQRGAVTVVKRYLIGAHVTGQIDQGRDRRPQQRDGRQQQEQHPDRRPRAPASAGRFCQLFPHPGLFPMLHSAAQAAHMPRCRRSAAKRLFKRAGDHISRIR